MTEAITASSSSLWSPSSSPLTIACGDTRCARLPWLGFRMLDQIHHQALLSLTLQPSKAKVLRRITFTHANLDHHFGTGRLSDLPFMFSSFNARSAEPISRHLHPRGSQCCVALIVLRRKWPSLVVIKLVLAELLYSALSDVTGRRNVDHAKS